MIEYTKLTFTATFHAKIPSPDATIGVFFDGFTKIIVGVSILTGLMGLSHEIVFGKIVSSIGMTAFLLLLFNTLYARHLAKKTGNMDLTAMPGGISGGTFFVLLYAILVPTFEIGRAHV